MRFGRRLIHGTGGKSAGTFSLLCTNIYGRVCGFTLCVVGRARSTRSTMDRAIVSTFRGVTGLGGRDDFGD